MSSKLIVMSNGATPEQQNAVTLTIKAHGAGWWHWFGQGWLIRDPYSRGAASWRDAIRSSVPHLHIFVVQVATPTDWAAFGTTEHFQWVIERWNVND